MSLQNQINRLQFFTSIVQLPSAKVNIPAMSNVPNTLINAQERVYSCRYCHKKFSSKQAFGGHQNAHKVERLVQRNAQERRNNFKHTWISSYYGKTFPTHPIAFNSIPKVLNQSIINRSYYSEAIQQATQGGSNFSHSMLPIAQYALQPDCGYPTWPKSILRNSQFITPPPKMDNQTVSMWNSTFGTTNFNAGTVLDMSEYLSASSFAQSTHDRNGNTDLEKNQEGLDSGLDLSLRL